MESPTLFPLRPLASCAIAVSLLLGISTSAQAILIDFETVSGYQTGDLYNQPGQGGSSKWKTPSYYINTSAISVTSGVGVGGSQAIQANANASITSAYYFLGVTNADLGEEFNKDSSKISFSFQLKWDGLSSFQNAGRFFIGSKNEADLAGDVVRIIWGTDGSMGYVIGTSSGGTESLSVKDAAGNAFRATANTFYTIQGTIDYSTKTYKLSINSVTQFDSTSSANLRFYAPNGTNVNANIELMTLNNNTTGFRTWVIDDLNYTAVPEPSSVATLGLSAAALGLALLRQKKAQKKA